MSDELNTENGQPVADAPVDTTTPERDPIIGGQGTAPVEPAGDEPKVDGKQPEPTKAETSWPEDWRDKASGGDEKVKKILDRYASPKDIAKALVEAQTALRTRPAAKNEPFPEKGTEDEQRAWREQNGVPADIKGYEIEGFDKLPDDLKQNYQGFLEEAHKRNMPASTVKEAVAIYRQMEQAATDKLVEEDITREETARDTLIDEFGGRVEFKRNVAMADNYVSARFGELGPLLMHGRLADGSKIGSNPEVIKFFVNLARDEGYAGDLVPDNPGAGGRSIDDRLSEIEALMRKDGGKEYWSDAKVQKEYNDLLQAQERRSGKGR